MIRKKMEYRSYEEYEKKYYPTTVSKQSIKEEDPYDVGVKLAKESLDKFKDILLKHN